MESEELVRYLAGRADDFAKQLEVKTQECEQKDEVRCVNQKLTETRMNYIDKEDRYKDRILQLERTLLDVYGLLRVYQGLKEVKPTTLQMLANSIGGILWDDQKRKL